MLMNSHVRLLLSRFERQELLRVCNEKMVFAARDLAEFTKKGINADYIVQLAYKCEDFEKLLSTHAKVKAIAKLKQMETEIRDALARICETASEIWASDPAKFKDYEIIDIRFSQPPSFYVA